MLSKGYPPAFFSYYTMDIAAGIVNLRHVSRYCKLAAWRHPHFSPTD
ncbi:hypothetical protein HMPREF1548_02863 [Clostridium sp. KLE 1755]|nr:hypothetical protein HMPREF1548_02863 [Clostridium sp. KLE 1755]